MKCAKHLCQSNHKKNRILEQKQFTYFWCFFHFEYTCECVIGRGLIAEQTVAGIISVNKALLRTSQLRSTENVQTFVCYAFFIWSIYQKLSCWAKTNTQLNLYNAANFEICTSTSYVNNVSMFFVQIHFYNLHNFYCCRY